MEPLRFEEDVKTVEVIVGQNTYTLTEASEGAHTKYQNKISSCVKFGPDGSAVGAKDLADVEAYLLSMCLTNGEGKHVSIDIIRKWPVRYVKEIVRVAKEISEIEEGGKGALLKQRAELDKRIEALDEAKNETSDIENS